MNIECHIKYSRSRPGPNDAFLGNDYFVYVKAYNGWDVEVILPESQIFDDGFLAWVIQEDESKALIELPRAASNGHWRIWVPRESVIRKEM